ncbi:RNA polymerase sigma factor [Streptomyces tuirus]|uniref:DNA-directed RNA polymerase sigma-70 factor n=1 Tax=Streptomyces tuirus TaxID=68278 RepID=A0A7G1NEI0_9ACTN|nr:RNA polymerase sigma factor [Streptomyces tuirus]BCL21568.1 hypothetical protein GCM10017668_34110 [Streptomyces tuirus]
MARQQSDWFEDAYQQTRHHVWRYLLRRLPRAEVEDALADVYVRAWNSRRSLRGEPLPWLYGIARHVVAATLAEAGKPQDPPWIRADASSAEEEATVRSEALRALRRLNPKEREAVLLIAWEGLTPRQAARAAGCTTAAITLRLHRARRRLEREDEHEHS